MKPFSIIFIASVLFSFVSVGVYADSPSPTIDPEDAEWITEVQSEIQDSVKEADKASKDAIKRFNVSKMLPNWVTKSQRQIFSKGSKVHIRSLMTTNRLKFVVERLNKYFDKKISEATDQTDRVEWERRAALSIGFLLSDSSEGIAYFANEFQRIADEIDAVIITEVKGNLAAASELEKQYPDRYNKTVIDFTDTLRKLETAKENYILAAKAHTQMAQNYSQTATRHMMLATLANAYKSLAEELCKEAAQAKSYSEELLNKLFQAKQ